MTKSHKNTLIDLFISFGWREGGLGRSIEANDVVAIKPIVNGTYKKTKINIKKYFISM